MIYQTLPTNDPNYNYIVFDSIGYPVEIDKTIEPMEGKIYLIDNELKIKIVDDLRFLTYYSKQDSRNQVINKNIILDQSFIDDYTDRTPPDHKNKYKFLETLWVLDRQFYINKNLSDKKEQIKNLDKTYYNTIQFDGDQFDSSGRHSENIRILLNSNINLESVVWYSVNFNPHTFTREQYEDLFRQINSDIFEGMKKVYESKWELETNIETYSDSKLIELYGNA